LDYFRTYGLFQDIVSYFKQVLIGPVVVAAKITQGVQLPSILNCIHKSSTPYYKIVASITDWQAKPFLCSERQWQETVLTKRLEYIIH
jgi:hypothetical protein